MTEKMGNRGEAWIHGESMTMNACVAHNSPFPNNVEFLKISYSIILYNKPCRIGMVSNDQFRYNIFLVALV